MKALKIVLLFVLVLFAQSCKKSSASYDYEEYEYETSEQFPDGTYCADVEYYNPETGTRSSYTLNVDVESNEVTVIHFSRGWLDDSEFSSETLDDNGYCNITLYDGREFEIQITGSECSFDDGYRIENDIQDEIAAVTCPNCGSDKYEYDDYCDDCQDKIDKTCKRCGQYDAFMWAGDDLCSDCERSDEYDE